MILNVINLIYLECNETVAQLRLKHTCCVILSSVWIIEDTMRYSYRYGRCYNNNPCECNRSVIPYIVVVRYENGRERETQINGANILRRIELYAVCYCDILQLSSIHIAFHVIPFHSRQFCGITNKRQPCSARTQRHSNTRNIAIKFIIMTFLNNCCFVRYAVCALHSHMDRH